VAVINAFGASYFLVDEAPAGFASGILSNDGERLSRRNEHYERVVLPFRNMFQSVESWEQLTVPRILRGSVENAEILSITLESTNNPSLKTLEEVLGDIRDIYSVLERLAGSQADLEIVSIQSGSGININLKGSGELLKEFRLLLAEVWNRVRFKAQDEQIANNNVLLSTLTVLKEIEKRGKEKALSPEEAEAMKRTVLKSSVRLINAHALPTGQSGVEVIDNAKLLQAFNPRLLPSQTKPSGMADEASTVRSEAKAETRGPKKPSKTRTRVNSLTRR